MKVNHKSQGNSVFAVLLWCRHYGPGIEPCHNPSGPQGNWPGKSNATSTPRRTEKRSATFPEVPARDALRNVRETSLHPPSDNKLNGCSLASSCGYCLWGCSACLTV